LVLKNKLDLISNSIELFEYEEIKPKFTFLLNHVAMNGTYEETVKLYNEYIQKSDDIYLQIDIIMIMMEKLHETGTEEAFEKQKEIRCRIAPKHRYLVQDRHFLTALEMKKYDYIINTVKKSITDDSIFDANIRMIALIRIGQVEEALNCLKKFIEFNSNLLVPILYDETVNLFN
jgi:tetratricopeptide (TPR) repeat protein